MNPFANPADLAHLHLWLNHVPTIGTVLGVGLLLLAITRNNDDLKKVSLEVFFVIALAMFPAYMSGVAAHGVLTQTAGISEAAIAAHQSAALLALMCMEITGAVAWFALWQFRRRARPPRDTLAAVFVLSMVALVVMAWAANLGGHIRHPEILSTTAANAVDSGPPLIDVAALGESVIGHLWVWPTGETLHFIGMSLSFGVLLVVNLHLLGFMSNVPFAAVHRLLPWGILGLAVNVMSGMVFFTGVPQQYLENPAFHWKVFLLMLAGLNYLYLTVFDHAWVLARGDRLPLMDRVMAASSLFLWVGVLYFGRMLPYLRSAF
jgi:uncharacterized membrane protein